MLEGEVGRGPSPRKGVRHMSMSRLHQSKAFSAEDRKLMMNDPKRHYFALVNMNSPFMLENIFVMYRRCMLGAMRDPSAIILAVVLTAVEEAILRSTLVHR